MQAAIVQHGLTENRSRVMLLMPAGPGMGRVDDAGDDEPVPAELVELDNTLAADVAAAVAKAAAESEAASMEGDSAPPSEPGGSQPPSPPDGERISSAVCV